MSRKVLYKARRIESLQCIISKWSLKCPECSKPFSSKFCLDRHVQIHREEGKTKKFECIVCKKRFQEIANYLRHCMFHDRNKQQSKSLPNGCLVQVQGEIHQSKQDEKSVNISGLSIEQINSVAKELSYEQVLLQNQFIAFKDGVFVLKDEFADNSESGGIFSCGHCPESFSDSSALCQHVASVHKQGFKCSICRNAFSTIEEYLQHKSAHEKKRYKCQFCPSTFGNKKSRTIHERVHTGEKPYQCDTCQRAFTQKSHLADHMRTHSGERPFACNQCSLAFTTHSSRRRHQRVVHRVGLKEEFPCDICGAVLSTKYSISLHLKRHESATTNTPEKKFLCTICNSYFSSSSSLRKHLKRMHDNEGGNTLCTICNFSYYSEATLKQHLSRAHGIAPSSSEKLESISCDECGALMQTKSGILIHKKRCHDKSS